jgi:poly(3-hydroxybutyrate) depolymerase
VKYVEDLIALMKSEYCVDENRIFVSGVSSGGHFTHTCPASWGQAVGGDSRSPRTWSRRR